MDTEWRVSVLSSAQSEVDRLSKGLRRDAIRAIVDLADDPFPPGSIRLRGHADVWRIRFGQARFRIIYRVSEKQRRVIVTRVRQRKDAYQGL